MLQKPEGFRAPVSGISASLQQGAKGEGVRHRALADCEPLATADLESSGFPDLSGVALCEAGRVKKLRKIDPILECTFDSFQVLWL